MFISFIPNPRLLEFQNGIDLGGCHFKFTLSVTLDRDLNHYVILVWKQAGRSPRSKVNSAEMRVFAAGMTD